MRFMLSSVYFLPRRTKTIQAFQSNKAHVSWREKKRSKS